MKKVFAFLLLAGCFASLLSQPKPEGGYIMRSTTGLYSIYAQDQAVNSMADWYTIKTATHDTLTTARLGATWRIKQIYNNSGSTQKVRVIFLQNTDTVTINISAYSATGKLPSIKKILSGAVADSTLYFIQVN
jgi:hypothetical protein